MLNPKILARLIGNLLFVETGMFFLCLLVSLIYREEAYRYFAISAAITLVVGFLLKYLGRHSSNNLSRRDSFFTVAVIWIIFSLFGVIPLMLSGSCANFTDAFFEDISGFTTTGISVIDDVEAQPRGILFWRSLSQWIGGLGIVIFTIMIIPSQGESSMRLFSAETTGLTREKLHPRIRTTLNGMLILYVLLTGACALCLWLCGMGGFDSINHAMTTTATGGFSTHPEGMMYFHSQAVEYVVIVFMFLAGINFPLLYVVFQRRKVQHLRENSEFRFYIGMIVLLTLVIIVALIVFTRQPFWSVFRHTLFSVVSVQTSTGFVSENIVSWWYPLTILLYIGMITGGCAGSTSGGIKCIRVLTLLKTARNHFRQLLHPAAFMPVKINHSIISHSVEKSLLAFIFLYLSLMFGGSLIFTSMGYTFAESVDLALNCLSNIGVIGIDSLSDAGKWLCDVLMLAGRLEIFPLLLPFVSDFWKNN